MDCFGTYFTHAQTCDNFRVQSATQWTASVHTLHMPKPVITFVFKVLHNGLLRYILYTCPNLPEAPFDTKKCVPLYFVCLLVFCSNWGLEKNVFEINLFHMPRLFLDTFWRHTTSAGADPPLSLLVNPLSWIAPDFSLYGTRGSPCVLLQQPRLYSSSDCLEPCV